MLKSKHLLSLKKVTDSQRKKFGINAKFSFRFNNKTPFNLIMTYSVPHLVNKNGKPVERKKRIQKNISQITIHNWKKWFKDETSYLIDAASEVEKAQQTASESFDNYRDEYDFGWWKNQFLERGFGKTTTMKPLSAHTIKQNKRILEPYYLWCMNNDSAANEMSSHIDNGADWFEKFYGEKLLDGSWSSTTCHTAFRNVRGFYNWVADRSKNRFPYDILKRLNIRRGENRRDTLNDWEFQRVIDFIKERKNDEIWKKFILMLRLQLMSGMRVGELVEIQNKNIDENDRTIWINGKSGRRPIHLRHKDDEPIWNDVIARKGKGKYLFYRTKLRFYPRQKYVLELDVDENLPTTSSYYLQRFRQMRDELGLRGKGVISSHSLRRYFITRFVKETKNRDLVRQIVGHQSTRMTDYYVGDMIDEDTKTTISIGV